MSILQQSISSQIILETRQALAQHRLYSLIDSPARLQFFMQHHVFCVWDFMSLVKSIQLSFTGCRLPWLPPKYPRLARLMNEIVLDEETDWIGNRPISHFELYLEAMRETCADLSSIHSLIEQIGEGHVLEWACEMAHVPKAACQFMSTTFQTLREIPEVQAAVFFHAREAIIPPMFVEMVGNLQQRGLNCDTLLLYLERHIALDGDEHGPKAQQMLDQIFAQNPGLYPVAIQAVEKAIQARLTLWDAIAVSLENFHPAN